MQKKKNGQHWASSDHTNNYIRYDYALAGNKLCLTNADSKHANQAEY